MDVLYYVLYTMEAMGVHGRIWRVSDNCAQVKKKDRLHSTLCFVYFAFHANIATNLAKD